LLTTAIPDNSMQLYHTSYTAELFVLRFGFCALYS